MLENVGAGGPNMRSRGFKSKWLEEGSADWVVSAARREAGVWLRKPGHRKTTKNTVSYCKRKR